MTQAILGPEQHSEEWRDLRTYNPERERKVVFGASLASTIMTNPLEAFLLCTGRKPPFEGNEYTEVGSLLEDDVLELYQRRTNRKAEANRSMWFHHEHQFIAATPDAWTIDESPHRNVQCKSATDYRFHKNADDMDSYGEAETDQVPANVLWQVQQEMLVMGDTITDIPVLAGLKVRIYTVPFEPTLAQALAAAEKELYERIVRDEPPEPHWQHPNTRECLKALYGLQEGMTVELNEEAREHWLELQRIKVEISNLEAQGEEHKNRVLAAMGSAELGNMPGGGKQIKRTVIKPQIWSQADIDKAMASLGTEKKKGHERLTERKRT